MYTRHHPPRYCVYTIYIWYGHCTSTPIIGSCYSCYLYCFYCSPSRFHTLLSLLYYIFPTSLIILILLLLLFPLLRRRASRTSGSQYRLPTGCVCVCACIHAIYRYNNIIYYTIILTHKVYTAISQICEYTSISSGVPYPSIALTA